jgi:hypothetical protein|tara:strand:- start:4495 stop:4755 length:261 start_codon:yes stop_codon:yes gene_type:complete
MKPLEKNATETITLEEFRDNFQGVVSQCERGQNYRIESEFGLLELRVLDETRHVRPLVKPTWPPAGNFKSEEYREFERRLDGPCDI